MWVLWWFVFLAFGGVWGVLESMATEQYGAIRHLVRGVFDKGHSPSSLELLPHQIGDGTSKPLPPTLKQERSTLRSHRNIQPPTQLALTTHAANLTDRTLARWERAPDGLVAMVSSMAVKIDGVVDSGQQSER